MIRYSNHFITQFSDSLCMKKNFMRASLVGFIYQGLDMNRKNFIFKQLTSWGVS